MKTNNKYKLPPEKDWDKTLQDWIRHTQRTVNEVGRQMFYNTMLAKSMRDSRYILYENGDILFDRFMLVTKHGDILPSKEALSI